MSTILPNPNQPLPDEIKAALSFNKTTKNNQPTRIDITIEINDWMKKPEAIAHLKHTQTLIQRFLLELSHPAPSCRLSIFEDGEFSLISDENADQELS